MVELEEKGAKSVKCSKLLQRCLYTLSVGFISLTAFSPTSLAQSFSRPPELEQLVYFQGVWRCEQPTADTSESVALTWKVERDLNGFWFIGYAEEIPSATNSQPVSSRDFLGYDTAAKLFVRSVVVSNGNSLNLTSPSWQNNQFVWQGSVVRTGRSMPIREVITKESANRFAAIYFVLNDAKEGWQPVVNEICRRQI
jgi:hypothetical protein